MESSSQVSTSEGRRSALVRMSPSAGRHHGCDADELAAPEAVLHGPALERQQSREILRGHGGNPELRRLVSLTASAFTDYD